MFTAVKFKSNCNKLFLFFTYSSIWNLRLSDINTQLLLLAKQARINTSFKICYLGWSFVDYQKGIQSERFIHNYTYDLNNKLQNITTAIDTAVTPIQQVTYFYYLKEKIKRLEIGNKLQGLDF